MHFIVHAWSCFRYADFSDLSLNGRLKQALNAGFRHVIFEDNYDTGTGDHYSLRQICDQFYIRGVLFSLLVSIVWSYM